MHVERGGIELGQDIYLIETGIDAIRYRDVDDAMLAAERNGGLRSLFRQGIEAGSFSASQDDR